MTAFSPSQAPLDGVLLVDKPAGPTSHDVVHRIRKTFRIDKVGHGGTLDPNATGLLVIL
ncbi:MAG: tRNA pseudouridine(55) synthase TruB, partial [Kiritimatiellae bacterium]|nr:tRNA pseudouridine(55) synthase TruB [Kiritimatiellia bacterium]